LTAPKKNKAAPQSGITRDEWLAALGLGASDEGDGDPSALTQPEYARLMQVPLATARGHLLSLVRDGKAVRTFKWTTNHYGRRLRYIAYKLR